MKKSHTFIADGNAMNIGFGFIPSEVHAIIDIDDTELRLDWYKVLTDASAVGLYGIIDDGAGVLAPCASAAAGIAEYDSVTAQQMLPAPDGDDYRGASLPNPWTTARSTAATARSTTALGTIIKPTSGNETGLIYECTTAGTGSATEPTWPTKAGDSVTDGSTVWIARDSIIKQVGQKGITIGADISTDGDVWVITAETHDQFDDKGDAGNFGADEVL